MCLWKLLQCVCSFILHSFYSVCGGEGYVSMYFIQSYFIYLFICITQIIRIVWRGGAMYSLWKIILFMVSFSDLKYKLIFQISTHYFSGLISCIFKWNSFLVFFVFSVVHCFQGTSVSITFYLFELSQLWMMDSKAQRVFFPKTPRLCVAHWSQHLISFKLGRSFSAVSPTMGSAG